MVAASAYLDIGNPDAAAIASAFRNSLRFMCMYRISVACCVGSAGGYRFERLIRQVADGALARAGANDTSQRPLPARKRGSAVGAAIARAQAAYRGGRRKASIARGDRRLDRPLLALVVGPTHRD